MKYPTLGLLLVLSAFAVQAQPSAAPVAPEAAGPVETVEPAESDESAEGLEPAADANADGEAVAGTEPARHCLRHTGTRLKQRDRDGCTHAIGESYSGEELRRTGARDTAEALRTLSPRIGG